MKCKKTCAGKMRCRIYYDMLSECERSDRKILSRLREVYGSCRIADGSHGRYIKKIYGSDVKVDF